MEDGEIMQFKPEFIPKIINGTKTQTRRLVKEGEGLATTTDKKSLKEWNEGKEISNKNPKIWDEVRTKKGKIKWQVGNDYAVQKKRGGKCIIYNPKTGEFTDDY